MNEEQLVKEIIPIDERWEKGIEHDPRSIEIMKFIQEYDFKFCGDWFCWKKGGDGDNGEQLMYELDEYFASLGKGYRKQTDTVREFVSKIYQQMLTALQHNSWKITAEKVLRFIIKVAAEYGVEAE